MTAWRVRGVVMACAVCLIFVDVAAAQPRGNPNPLRMLTKTIYTPKTEFFAVYRPYVVGEEGRFTAHLSRITDRFEAYPENVQLTFALTVGGVTVEQQRPSTIERSGHFAFAFTPAAAGRGTATVVLTTPEGSERFVFDNIVVEPNMASALQHQEPAPAADGSIRYTKEESWDGRFATAPVGTVALAAGTAATVAVPRTSIVTIEGRPHVYVQRDPEAFFLRAVTTGGSNDGFIAITDGLREGDRVVTLGAEAMPRK